MNMILRYTFNLPISLKKLQDLMQYKYIESEDLERESVIKASSFLNLMAELETLIPNLVFFVSAIDSS